MSKELEAVEVNYLNLSLEDGLNEISQTKNMRFAFLYHGDDGKLRSFHPLVKCRDYLSDVLHFKAVEKPAHIYGFSLTPETNRIDLERTRLLVEVPSGARNAFIQNFPFIQRIETEKFNISPSKLFSVKEHSNRFVIDADPFWLNCTQLVSMLTYLCRCSLYLEKPTDNWIEVLSKCTGVDGSYMKTLRKFHVDVQIPFFAKLDYSKSETPSGFPTSASVSWVHNTGGFLSFITRGDMYRDSNGIEGAKAFPYLLANDLIKQMQLFTGI